MGEVRAVGRVAQIIERFKRASNFKIVPNTNGKGYTFNIPGFKYDDFDRAGFVNLVKINRTMETSRFVNIDLSGGATRRPQQQPGMFFMFGTHLRVAERLYRSAAVERPMTFGAGYSAVGTSSVDVFQTMSDAATRDILATRLCRAVHVDSVTRRSAPMPDGIRDAFLAELAPETDDGDGRHRFPELPFPLAVPHRHHACDVTVRHADLDFLFHANQGAYLGFAFECAAGAAAAGHYTRIRDDVCFYPAKTGSGLHLAETHAGDRLRVYTWEDADDPLLVYFVVRKDDADVYYGKVEFYDREDFAPVEKTAESGGRPRL